MFTGIISSDGNHPGASFPANRVTLEFTVDEEHRLVLSPLTGLDGSNTATKESTDILVDTNHRPIVSPL